MDDIRVGRGLRRLRHRRTLTQEQIAALCDESQDSVSRIDRGHLADMPLRRVRAIARALDAEIVVALRWRGGVLDRLIDEGHAVIVGRVAGLLEGAGWIIRTEVSYSVYGERGSIDLLAWHPPTRTLLVVEVKTEVISVEATLRKHDEKVRLARRIASERFGWVGGSVSRLLVLPDLSTPRRHVERHGQIMVSAYPMRGAAVRTWIRSPGAGGPTSGILFVSPTQDVRGRRGPVSRKRVRQPRSGALSA